jgi:acylphosphatase
MMPALRVRISGFVQGVGFRAFVIREARALALKGWVRNRRDGTVEALASGPQAALETFVARCRQGPYSAGVQSVQVQASDEEPGDSFKQLPTQ